MNMEDCDNHQICIKTEVEDVTENGVPNSKSIIFEVHELDMIDKKDNLTEVKFESGDENDEYLFANKCKLDMDVETYDEFCNLDSTRPINLDEFKSNMTKAEKISEKTFEPETYSATQTKDVDKKSLYECGLCNYITNYESDLRQHRIKHTFMRWHRGRFRTMPKSYQKSPQETHHESKKCKCDKCLFLKKGKDFPTEHQIMVHESKSKCELEKMVKTYDHFDHTYAKSINQNEFNTNLTKGEEVTNNNVLLASRTDTAATEDFRNENQFYRCDQCDYKTYRKTYMKRHKKSHWVVKPFQCHMCSFQSNSQPYFHRHRLSHKDKLFKCDMCNYTTWRRDLLRRHHIKHSEVKQFKCDECFFKTKTKVNLQSHQLVHTQKRPVECDMYDYT